MTNFHKNTIIPLVHGAYWLTERQVAQLIGISLSKLRSDRHKCRGIPYCKVGRSVRYAQGDVNAFMAENRIRGFDGEV